MTLNTRKVLSLFLIPIFLALIAIFLFLNIGSTFNPPILLLLFNTLFLGLIPLYVAYIAYKSFRASGSNGVLLKGIGMLLLGLGAIAAGIVNYLPDSMNANVTVHNTSFCVGAFFQFIGILIALSGTMPRQRPGDGLKIAAIYSGIVVIFCSFVVVTVLGIVPPFFIQSVGFTVLRELIITGAILFFALASAILFWLYYDRKEEFFFWYSIGLALIAIGLLAVHFPSILGSPLGWVGRSAQYFGAVYVLIAFIALDRSARQTGTSIPVMLSRFFGEAETSYKALVETATDAIVVFDSTDRVIVWNRAAERMFGYSEAEATGASFFGLAIPEESAAVIRNNFMAPADLPAHKSVEITARRKDGSLFPAGMSLSRHMVAGTLVSTCIVHDMTESRKAESDLKQQNEDLLALTEELTSTQEDLHQTIEDLTVTEKTLRESEERYRLQSETMLQGVVHQDAGGTIISMNPAAERILGRIRTEFLGSSSVGEEHHTVRENGERFPGEEHPAMIALRTGLPVRGVVMGIFNPKLGEYRWISIDAVPVILPGRENPSEVYTIFEDITNRRHAERALRESEERFRTIAETLPVLISLSSTDDSTILFTNTAYNKAFGFSSEEIIGRIGPDVYYDPSERTKMIAAIREQGFVSNYRLKAKKADGTPLWLLSSVRPILYDGKPAIIGASIDIMDLVHAEETLKETHLRTNAILEGIADTFYSLDEAWRFVTVNPAAEKAPFGRPAAEMLGKVIWELYPSLVGTRIHRYYLDAAEKHSLEHYEAQSPLNGRWYEVFMKGMKGGVDVYMRDVTERKKAENELALRNEQLLAINEELTATEEELHQNLEELSKREEDLSKALAEKEVLLAEIHHRVKNNLTAFISLLSLEGSTEETPTGKQLKLDLQNRARSMALVHETLYRTHLYNEVDMEMYLKTLVEQIAQSFGTKRAVKTVVDAQNVLLDIPRATPAGLIVNELVTNSFKYAFPASSDSLALQNAPPVIRISLSKNNGMYEMIVRDNGIGLPPGFDLSTTRTLGLKLVNFLGRHQMRANIEVTSGNGTEFIIRFEDQAP